MTDPSIADPPSPYSPVIVAKPAPPVARPGGRTNKIAAGRTHFRDALAVGSAEYSQPNRVCRRDHL
jgi:hypothetical protein